jgi:hypothetical protein
VLAHPHRLALLALLAVVAAWAGLLAAAVRAADLPDDAAGLVAVVFPPGTPPEEALARTLAAGGLPVRRTAPPGALLAFAEAPGFAGRLREAGAYLVLGDFPFGPVLAGCAGLGAPDPAGGRRRP